MSFKKIHGETDTPTWRSWRCMMQRCYLPSDRAFSRYGKRGIIVIQAWHSYVGFVADMGHRPEGTTLGRINNDGNYEPSNCRWETYKQQSRNTRTNHIITFNGESMPMVAWAERLGMKSVSLCNRIMTKKWSIERALTQPLRSW